MSNEVEKNEETTDNNVYLEKVEFLEEITAEMSEVLKPFDNIPVADCYKDAEAAVIKFIEKKLAEFGLHPIVRVEAVLEGENCKFKTKDLYSAAIMHGLNPRNGEMSSDDKYLMWKFSEGTLRQDKETLEVVRIPPVIADQIDVNAHI